MAFDLGLLTNTTGPYGADANMHTLHLLCQGSTQDSADYLIIDKIWIDNYNNTISIPGNENLVMSGLPQMRYFPFFFFSHELILGEQYSFNNDFPDGFPYYQSFLVENGTIVHPLSYYNYNVGGSVFFNQDNWFGWNSLMRDNYRLNGRFKIRNRYFHNDKLIVKIMFSTDIMDEFSGDLNIHYRIYDASRDNIFNKTRVIPLTGDKRKTNVSEVDYTLFGDIHELDEIEVSSPFVAIELF